MRPAIRLALTGDDASVGLKAQAKEMPAERSFDPLRMAPNGFEWLRMTLSRRSAAL